MPEISIITICLNEPLLERTCASIAAQTFRDFEWIVIDGGSTHPETLAILVNYRAQMTRFVSEKDSGIYDAMNKGLALASGRWINFMNGSDRFSSPDTLEKMSRELDTHQADIVYGMVHYDGAGGQKIDCLRIPDKEIDEFFWGAGTTPHPAMFYQTELFRKYGGYRTDYRIVSDWVRNLTFWRQGARFKFVDIMVADYDNTGISSHRIEQRQSEGRRVVREYFPKFHPGQKLKRYLYRLLYGISIGWPLRPRLKWRYKAYSRMR